MFGDTVRTHRRRLGLTQEELAARTGVSVRGLRQIEGNKIDAPRAATVRLLADAFGLCGADRDRFCDTALVKASDRPAGPWVPAQLPPDVPVFVGRDAELAQLDAFLAGTRAAEAPSEAGAGAGERAETAAPISAVSGTAGVGKTALAVHWAHRARDQFPDGQLYVNLRGFDPSGSPMSPTEAVRHLLDALDVPAQRIPHTLQAQVGLYRSLLARRRMLILLDNAHDAEQVRPLLPGAPRCAVLATSRSLLHGLVAVEGAAPLILDVLSSDEAQQMMVRRLGERRTMAEPEAVDEIISRCSRLPLALAILAARAVIRPNFALSTLTGELREAQLDVLDGGDTATDIRGVFSWSYQQLGSEAADLFRLLGIHTGPDITISAAASLAGVPPEQAHRRLAELTRAHLLTEHTPGRYASHDLLRAYAAELAQTMETDTERRRAQTRVLDHYLHTAHSAAQLLKPYRIPIPLAAPQPGTVVETLRDHDAALAWLAGRRPVLVAAIRQSARAGFDRHAWQLAWAIVDFFQRQGHWLDQALTHQIALDAARRLSDHSGQAHAHRGLARAFLRLGRYREATTCLRQALDLHIAIGDRTGQAETNRGLAYVLGQQGQHTDALDHAQRALDLSASDGDRAGQAEALNSLGCLHAGLGDYHNALACCQQALTLFEHIGDQYDQAETWDSLGHAHHHLGHHDRAITCYHHALSLFRAAGDRYQEADTLDHLGDAHHAAGNPHASHTAWRCALDILSELGHPDADTVQAKINNPHQNHNRRNALPVST